MLESSRIGRCLKCYKESETLQLYMEQKLHVDEIEVVDSVDAMGSITAKNTCRGNAPIFLYSVILGSNSLPVYDVYVVCLYVIAKTVSVGIFPTN